MSRLSSTTTRFPLPSRGKNTELSRNTSRSEKNSPLSPTSREDEIKSSTPGPPTSPVTSKFRRQDSADLSHQENRKSPKSPGSDWETVSVDNGPQGTAREDKDRSGRNGPKNDGAPTSTSPQGNEKLPRSIFPRDVDPEETKTSERGSNVDNNIYGQDDGPSKSRNISQSADEGPLTLNKLHSLLTSEGLPSTETAGGAYTGTPVITRRSEPSQF